MKSINNPEEESYPSLITSSEYSVFTSENLTFISNSSDDSLLVDDLVLEETWGWLYIRFSRNKVLWLRSLYSLSYLVESMCFVLSISLSKLNNLSYSDIPFTVDPYFKLVSWVFVLSLGFPFLKVLYSNTISSINLISWHINLLFLPVYVLLSILFVHRAVPTYEYSQITEDITILLSMIIVLIIYGKVKYRDDGRYKVGLVEFSGVQVHFSSLLSMLLVESCEGVFKTLGYYMDSNSNDKEFLGWQGENWTILVMILTCWTGSLILYLYKDVFYAGVLAFTYIGIFSIQRRMLCPDHHENCSQSVSTTALALGSLLFFFIFITFITYPKLVMYSVRKTSD